MDNSRVKLSADRYWTWISRPISRENSFPFITGKYLFFSSDRKKLLAVARDEIEHNEFRLAKVSKKAIGGEHVLCLYYSDDSRKNELAERYRNLPELKYRYWKSDADTMAGKYSKEFLNKMPKAERSKWTSPE
jgi:hypothetical protein